MTERKINMKFRYYVQLASGRWSEVNYSFYEAYKGNKKRSPFNILDKLNGN